MVVVAAADAVVTVVIVALATNPHTISLYLFKKHLPVLDRKMFFYALYLLDLFLFAMEGFVLMFYQTESKAQVWRALVVFENRSEMLLFVGRSSEQVRANIEPAFNDLLDDEEKSKAQSISLQRWHGAPDAGRWMHQTNLTMPSKTLLAKVA